MSAAFDALNVPRVRLRAAGIFVRVIGDLRVLDESRVATPLGGSKVRSLEYLLGAASGGDIVTMGPAGSQHLLASAVFGKRAGLRVHAIAWPQPKTEGVVRSLRALHAHAEEVWPTESHQTALLTLGRVVATVRFLAGYPPVVWPPGGNGPVGVLGWVRAGLELASARAGELTGIERVIVPMGSGGLAVGLSLGFALSGAPVEVVAVDVTGGGRAVLDVVSWRTRRFLRERGLVAPRGRLRVVPERSAYGVATPGGIAAQEIAASAGIFVDPTYGSKALAVGLCDSEPSKCLFVATANAQPLDPLLEGALAEVPGRLAGLVR